MADEFATGLVTALTGGLRGYREQSAQNEASRLEKEKLALTKKDQAERSERADKQLLSSQLSTIVQAGNLSGQVLSPEFLNLLAQNIVQTTGIQPFRQDPGRVTQREVFTEEKRQAKTGESLSERQFQAGEGRFKKTFEEGKRQFGVQTNLQLDRIEAEKQRFSQTIEEEKRQFNVSSEQRQQQLSQQAQQFVDELAFRKSEAKRSGKQFEKELSFHKDTAKQQAIALRRKQIREFSFRRDQLDEQRRQFNAESFIAGMQVLSAQVASGSIDPEQAREIANDSFGRDIKFNDRGQPAGIDLSDPKSANLLLTFSQRHDQAVKDYSIVEDHVAIMRSALDAVRRGGDVNRIATDEAIIVAFERLLDPNSVVREGEFKRVEAGAGLLNRARALKQKIKGGRLPVDQLDALVKVGEEMAEAKRQILNMRLQDKLRPQARAVGLDPDLAVPLIPARGQAVSSPSVSQAAGTQSGFDVTKYVDSFF